MCSTMVNRYVVPSAVGRAIKGAVETQSAGLDGILVPPYCEQSLSRVDSPVRHTPCRQVKSVWHEEQPHP